MLRILLLSLLVLAQAPVSAPSPAPYSDLEQAKLEALTQEGAKLQAEQRALDLERERWQAKVAALKAEMEHARGDKFTWNPTTGKFDPVPPKKDGGL